MFELNDNLEVNTEIFQDSKIFTIDNFYKNPDLIFDCLFGIPAPFFKEHDYPSFNGIFFEDRRVREYDVRLKPVVNFLSKLASQKPDTYDVATNQQRFYDDEFNDYKNCIWWPHVDVGYNGIVYFNKNDTECGTNLYSKVTDSVEMTAYNTQTEHYAPWRQREKYEKLKTLTPKYNRLVLFDGDKFLHGMNIVNDRYFSDEYRCNQVFFFKRRRPA